MRVTVAPAALPVLLAALLVSPAASADFWSCKDKEGRSWITNEKKPGMRCRLAMKTPGSSTPSSGGSSSSGRVDGKFRPPKIGQPDAPAEETGSVSERLRLYQSYIDEAAAKYRVPAQFIQAVIRVESNFRYRAVSPVGAQGLMQLMPRTARAMGVNDAFDPRQNILGGARLLRYLANKHDGDFIKVLSAYHAGSGAVAKKEGIPFEGTEGYVRVVLKHYYRYKDAAADG